MGPGGHSHEPHGHAPGLDTDLRWLSGALTLIVGFMLVEVLVGLAASSMALLSDAAHMLTDAAAIGLAVLAARLAARPARGNFTFGLKRAEILSALVNGVTLLLLVVWFTVEALRRLADPPEVRGGLVLVTALIGLAVNLVATWLLSRAGRRSLSVRGALLHLVNDAIAFGATALAGLVVLVTGWRPADAVATLVVAGLMAWAGVGLVTASSRIFLEAAPVGVDVAAIDADVHALAGVTDIHDLHVWEVTSGFPALSAHVLVAPDRDCHERRAAIEDLLARRYRIEHTTLQVDHAAPTVFPAAQLSGRDPGRTWVEGH